MIASELNALADAASAAGLAGDYATALANLQALAFKLAAQPDLTATTRDGVTWDRQFVIALIADTKRSYGSRAGIQSTKFVPSRTTGGSFACE